jgi:hypothetical protein
MVTADFSF